MTLLTPQREDSHLSHRAPKRDKDSLAAKKIMPAACASLRLAASLAMIALMLLAAGAEAARPAPQMIAPFGPCNPPINGSAVFQVACATALVPLNWYDAFNSANLTLSIMRIAPSAAPKNTTVQAVWYLGDAGLCDVFGADAVLAPWVEPVVAAGFTVYLPELRGSSALQPQFGTCNPGATPPPTAATNWPTVACATYLGTALGSSALSFYSLTLAAADVNFLINITSLEGHAAVHHVLASGFGTLWAQELTSAFPTAVSRVVLSSPAAPNAYDIFFALGSVSNVVRTVLDDCAHDPTCSAQLGAGSMDVRRFLDTTVVAKLDDCLVLAGAGGRTLEILAALVELQTPTLLGMIPALLYRLWRCSGTLGDLLAVRTFSALLTRQWMLRRGGVGATVVSGAIVGGMAATCGGAQLARANILLNEFVSNDPSATTPVLASGAVPPSLAAIQDLTQLYDAWPKYDPLAGTAANMVVHGYPNPTAFAASHTLLVAGALDVVTPVEGAYFASLWYATSAPVVTLRYKGHGALTATSDSCALQCAVAFLSSDAPVMPACAAAGQQGGLDLLGTDVMLSVIRFQFFGTNDSWGYQRPNATTVPILPPDVPTPPPLAPPPPRHLSPGGVAAIVIVVLAVAVVTTLVVIRLRRPKDPFEHLRNDGSGGAAGGAINRSSIATSSQPPAAVGYGGVPYSAVPPPSAGQPTWR